MPVPVIGTSNMVSSGERVVAGALPLEPVSSASSAVEHGEVFTRRWVVELILDLCGYRADHDLAAMVAIEPSCGSGAFLVPMVKRLVASAERHGRSLPDAVDALRAVDLRPANVEASRRAVERTLRSGGVSRAVAARLSRSWVAHEDFLLHPPEQGSADFVLGNPPYIRLEALPRARSEAYRRACITMGGRADVYIGFYEHGLLALKPMGVLGFICADRWMRNAYGSRLRSMVSSGWSVEAVISMTGVDAFESEVDAYPAITVLRRGCQHTRPLVVESSPEFAENAAIEVAKLARTEKVERTAATGYRAARLDRWFEGAGGWPTGSPDRLALLADLESRFPLLADPATGTRVGIGVATGADKIFITTNPELVEPERLLPLALPRDIASGEVKWSGKYLVNPWDESGLVDLDDWRRMAAYLEQHRSALAKRHTARTGRWYKTIDRVIKGLAERPKLFLPDFKDMIFPVFDDGKTYPHHNLYWITSERWDLRVLGGLLLSDVANLFIEAYSVRMRGGFLRFQAQYLRRIRVPQRATLDETSCEALAAAFDARDRVAATAIALRLYGLEGLPK